MVNILFLFSSTICKENVPFKPCTNITMIFFNKKRIDKFISLNKSKNAL